MDYDSTLLQASPLLIYAFDDRAFIFIQYHRFSQRISVEGLKQIHREDNLILDTTSSLKSIVWKRESSRLFRCKAKNGLRMTHWASCSLRPILYSVPDQIKNVLAANVCVKPGSLQFEKMCLPFLFLHSSSRGHWKFSFRFSIGNTKSFAPSLIRQVWNSPVFRCVVLIQFRRSRNHVVTDSSIL